MTIKRMILLADFPIDLTQQSRVRITLTWSDPSLTLTGMLKEAACFVLVRHRRLTIWRTSSDVPCLVRRGVDLAPSATVKGFGRCRLTDSPARTHVALFLHRAVRLLLCRLAELTAASLADRRVLARPGSAGEMRAFSNILLSPVHYHVRSV